MYYILFYFNSIRFNLINPSRIQKVIMSVYISNLSIYPRKLNHNMLAIRLLALTMTLIISSPGASANTNVTSVCSQFSAKDSDDFWVSIGRCAPCAQEQYCGFCQSTLQCLNGTVEGPLNGIPCPSWSFSSDSCPGTTFANVYISI